jgi:hypothetical protein
VEDIGRTRGEQEQEEEEGEEERREEEEEGEGEEDDGYSQLMRKWTPDRFGLDHHHSHHHSQQQQQQQHQEQQQQHQPPPQPRLSMRAQSATTGRQQQQQQQQQQRSMASARRARPAQPQQQQLSPPPTAPPPQSSLAPRAPAPERAPVSVTEREPLYFKVESARPDVTAIVSDVLLARPASAQPPRGPAGSRIGGALLPEARGAIARGAWALAPELGGGAAADAGLSPCGTFNLLWTWQRPCLSYDQLLRFQRVNHFPRSSARVLFRKDLLKKALAKCARMHGCAFDVMPSTYALPAEYVPFVAEFGRLEHELGKASNLWILKPVGSSRGRGIRVLNDISGVNYSQEVVLQRYIERPLLLGGCKFDLRVYVLLTSVRPLEAFIYTEGLARFASRGYTTAEGSLADPLVHITNTAVQRGAAAAAAASSTDGGSRGGADASAPGTAAEPVEREYGVDGAPRTKCSLAELRARVQSELGIAWAPLWTRVVETVTRSLVAVEDSIEPHTCAFELFGYDLLLAEQPRERGSSERDGGAVRAWLIEVNASPSLERESELDAQIKERLIADTVRLIAPPFFDRAVLQRMAEWRLADLAKGAKTASRLAPPPFARELCALLHGEGERRVGEMPQELGLYQRIVPSPFHERITRNKRAAAAPGAA